MREGGDGISALRAACWLDAKRSYFEHPDARRLYVVDHRAELDVLAAVVKSLRRKLGAHGGAIATVTGHGYRLGARGTAS